jgi:hypothetical protein
MVLKSPSRRIIKDKKNFERSFKMARFPKPEAEIVALAQAMVSGLTANAVIYPAPPVLPAALTTLVSD